MDSVAQTLQLLHMKFRMAVVTTSLRSNFKIAHEASGLLDFFELAVCREDYVKGQSRIQEPSHRGGGLVVA